MYQAELQHIIDSFKGKLPESEDFQKFLQEIDTSFKKSVAEKSYDPQLNIADAILVVENLTDLIALHEPDLTCTYISPACRTILGYEPEELRGMSAYDYFHPDDISVIGEAHEELLKSPDGQVVVPYRLRRKTGEYIWVEAISKVITDEKTGEIRKIIAAIRDISKRKEFEKELLEGQIRLELLNAIMEMRVENKPLEYIINYTLESLKEFFSEFRISYTSLDERTGIQSLDYMVGFSDEAQAMKGQTLDLNHVPEILEALKGRTPLIIADAYNDARLSHVKEYIERRGTRSIAYFPARYDVAHTGILSVGSEEMRELSDFEISAFKEVSQQLSATVREYRLRKERNAALEALSKRERELKTLLENTPDVIIRWNKDFRYTFINKAAEYFIGLPASEFLGKTIRDMNLEAPEFWENIAEEVFKTGKAESIEVSVRAPDGFKTYQISIVPERDEDSQVDRILFIGRDITDMKKAQDSLRQSEERFRTFMDNIPHMAFIKDESGRYVYANKALLGLGEELSSEILLKTDSEWLSEEFADEFRKIDQKVLSSDEPVENLDILKQHDRIHYYLSHKFPLKSTKGEKLIGGMAVDITDRIEAEETIRENEARFRIIFETAGIGIVLVSPTGYILKTNPSFEKISGYSGAELSLMHFKDLTHPDDQGIALNLFRTLSENEKDYYTYEKRYIRKDGGVIWVRAAASMVRSAAGKPMYIIGTVEDITQQRTYMNNLQNLTDELRLKNQELESARDAAESANKAKSVFLSSMSHELRTPLNAILGFAQILKKEDTLAPRQRSFIDTIYKSGAHLLEMINDVLDISKIESGRMELFPDNFDLYELLSDLHDMFNVAAHQKGITFNVSYSPQVPQMIFADAKRLRQVLINLLSNAVKFTSDGRISLHVAASQGQAFSELTFTVSDTGRGIPSGQLESIFEPFRQTEGTYSDGTGLGLAISRRIAQLMGGTISVESMPEEGSVFTFVVWVEEVHPAQWPMAGAAQSSVLLKSNDSAADPNSLPDSIVQAISALPAQYRNALTDAIEVQETGVIEHIVKAIFESGTTSDPYLLALSQAAHNADFKMLSQIAEILFQAERDKR